MSEIIKNICSECDEIGCYSLREAVEKMHSELSTMAAQNVAMREALEYIRKAFKPEGHYFEWRGEIGLDDTISDALSLPKIPP